MVNSGERDIIEQIDEVTELGEDAATWIAQAPQGESPREEAAPGKLLALLLGMDNGEFIEISRDTPDDDLLRLVGDPVASRMRLVTGVEFWIGDNSLHTSSVNQGASRFLEELLRDVVSGDYAVSDRVRKHVGNLLANPNWAPVIHGPCVVTGVDSTDTSSAAPFDDTFRHWLNRIVDRAAQRREQAVREALAAMGIPADVVGTIAIIGL